MSKSGFGKEIGEGIAWFLLLAGIAIVITACSNSSISTDPDTEAVKACGQVGGRPVLQHGWGGPKYERCDK